MTTPNQIDFAKVEVLRQRLGLSTADMASAMSVSRMTYHSWVHGGGMRPANARRVRKVVRILLDLLKDKLWFEEVISAGPTVRRERLLALVG